MTFHVPPSKAEERAIWRRQAKILQAQRYDIIVPDDERVEDAGLNEVEPVPLPKRKAEKKFAKPMPSVGAAP